MLQKGFAVFGLIAVITSFVVAVLLLGNLKRDNNKSSDVLAASAGSALRFYGSGANDIDRIKIPLDNPETKADVGTGDFTLEWWMTADLVDNAGAASCGSGPGWITGNIIFDRDIYGGGDYGDYGVSLSNGRIAFGVHNGSTQYTVCGSRNVSDGSWHHVAITRRNNGGIRIWVDGIQDASFMGPSGDISYRNGRNTSYPNSDPFLVIGAEKHDAGSAYPSYNGVLDEVRVSNNIRYSSGFTRPSAPFTNDQNTILLYHFDEGSGTTAIDSASNPLNGQIKIGGSPSGPVYVSSTAPLGGSEPTPSSTPVVTPTPTATPDNSITGLLTGYAFEENSGTTTADLSGNGWTLSLTGDPVWSAGKYGRGLVLDGANDRGARTSFGLPSQFTYMAWVNNPSNQGYETLITVGTGRDFYLQGGQLSFYDGSTERSFGLVPTGSWQHVALTFAGGQMRAYLNGQPLGSAQTLSLNTITNTLQVGMWDTNSDFLSATLDEVRVYNNALTQSEIQSAMSSPLSGQPAPTSTAIPTPSPTPSPTPTPTPTAVPTATATPVSGNLSLSFDGSNDRAATAIISSTGTKTVEAWVRPSTNGQNSIIMGNYNNNNGWSLELEGGRVAFWAGINGNWQNVVGGSALSANTWYHVAAAYNSSNSTATVFVNGTQVASGTVGQIGSVAAYSIGGSSGFPYFRGQIDEVRISNTQRYNSSFIRPTQTFVPDSATIILYHFDEQGQQVVDSSGNNYYMYLGGNSTTQSSDPTRLTSTVPF